MNFSLAYKCFETNTSVNNTFMKRNICVKIMSQYQSEDIFLRLQIRICVFSIKQLLELNCPSYLNILRKSRKTFLKLVCFSCICFNVYFAYNKYHINFFYKRKH